MNRKPDPIPWEIINPPADRTAPLTNMFGQILIAVHGGQENVSTELQAAMHLLRTIELATQQFGALAHALSKGDPDLDAMHNRILAPVLAVGCEMRKAFADPAPAPTELNPN